MGLRHRCLRISRREVLFRKGALESFAKSIGKNLCQSLFLIKACNFIKKRIWHRSFPVNFAKFLRTPIFIEELWWLVFMFDRFLNMSLWLGKNEAIIFFSTNHLFLNLFQIYFLAFHILKY